MKLKRFTAVSFASAFIGIALAQSYFEPTRSYNSALVLDNLSLISAFFWLLPLPLVGLNLVGLAIYERRAKVVPTQDRLVFRIVTRGFNKDAVTKTVANVKSVMTSVGAPPPYYLIEVVTDNYLPLEDEYTSVITVPENYTTPNASRFKARALHYALSASTAGDTDWLIHLDEESQVNPDTIYGIYSFIVDQQNKPLPSIGQGAILYHRELATNKFLTLADMVRTGDDMGRFHVQYRAGTCLFGMHGSFIVVRNDMEKSIGFDFGAAGSITEDAIWALRCFKQGYTFGWVDGFMYEQSPRSINDFLKQRRRWYVGIGKISSDTSIPWRHKWPVLLSWELWGAASLLTLATIINLINPVELPSFIRFGANLTFAGYLTVYLVGLYVNLCDAKASRVHKIYYGVLQVLLLPLHSILEAVAVIYGQIRPEMGFHVIKK